MRIILAALAVFFMPVVQADPAPPATGLIISVAVPACDTEEQMSEIWQAHLQGGEEGGRDAFYGFRAQFNEKGDPVCAHIRPPMMVMAVIDTAWLDFGKKLKWCALVRVLATDGVEYYALIVNGSEVPPTST